MRVFITGASGWIGTVLTEELVTAGHQVVGLARSEASAAKVATAGGAPVLGDMSDHDLIVQHAQQADAVAHLAFTLDFTKFAETVQNELELLEKLGKALESSGKAVFAASGTPTVEGGRAATERDELGSTGLAGPRAATAKAVLALADRGIRSGLVRLPRTVHGQGDHGLIAMLVGLDRQLGVAAYVGDGSSRWPAVHRSDAGHLFRLALEKAPAGSVLHAVAEEGVTMREIAEIIAARTGLPAGPIDPERMGPFGALVGGDQPASSTATRELLDWEPTGPSLLDDLRAGYYTT
ncbi:SDR family oxidoreductase [Actinoplanes utahensis]|uniref:3-beta hydroxysteroid dehydrogenase n=1 Tax=Actinoplanes utahensis TaxID=1869 RepID=A0A0A6WYW5_ACTUT|nr:SDR family oxidoreductase [Actinoplanes utahensis]KHD72962.1 3-beta hydroxysteroid dehydrogenase [Actinoplanes utahensis]GIF31133.1 3-beta hydroxysteroid dehydrogenase [Actinoplanes utahensis]